VTKKPDNKEAIIGCLLGTAVGDAMGLACEGLSRHRQQKLFPSLQRPQFFFGYGMVSDDTEHTSMVAQALIVSAGEESIFINSLARRLRFWLLGCPAGIGLATLKSILKLWMGFSPRSSGVFSAGNGPAMRSAIIGVCYGDNPERLRKLISLSTRITHTDPKAEYGALAIAIAAHHAAETRSTRISPDNYCQALRECMGREGQGLAVLVEQAAESAAQGKTTHSFAEDLGLRKGITGYTYHTVPVVLHAWFKHPKDYRTAIQEIIRCGGDADTTAAILGGIVGASVGKEGIPSEWLAAICERPRSVAWMEKLGEQLSCVIQTDTPQKPMSLSLPALLVRNALFALVVLGHGFRRLLPPY
jgi:ADP-ribosyl-[dinitrogen reductase] hydrolase